ncbi:hypothetical protein DL89DRAFT_137040 [Linderina pennispora]|uniref:Uncharacterized protein n=1 Tax=Linderina pennispora TaxID=61395 RepID=A0A1Y1WBF3_9FUNG|nr:uncharacterized protein DL89DRAFT_137040 [Linderina pennispora]ORX70648.1 hypothetical protein DL89DRAFT_137040 [Linderina pennispora]
MNQRRKLVLLHVAISQVPARCPRIQSALGLHGVNIHNFPVRLQLTAQRLHLELQLAALSATLKALLLQVQYLVLQAVHVLDALAQIGVAAVAAQDRVQVVVRRSVVVLEPVDLELALLCNDRPLALNLCQIPPHDLDLIGMGLHVHLALLKHLVHVLDLRLVRCALQLILCAHIVHLVVNRLQARLKLSLLLNLLQNLLPQRIAVSWRRASLCSRQCSLATLDAGAQQPRPPDRQHALQTTRGPNLPTAAGPAIRHAPPPGPSPAALALPWTADSCRPQSRRSCPALPYTSAPSSRSRGESAAHAHPAAAPCCQ